MTRPSSLPRDGAAAGSPVASAGRSGASTREVAVSGAARWPVAGGAGLCAFDVGGMAGGAGGAGSDQRTAAAVAAMATAPTILFMVMRVRVLGRHHTPNRAPTRAAPPQWRWSGAACRRRRSVSRVRNRCPVRQAAPASPVARDLRSHNPWRVPQRLLLPGPASAVWYLGRRWQAEGGGTAPGCCHGAGGSGATRPAGRGDAVTTATCFRSGAAARR